MYSEHIRQQARDLRASGLTWRAIATELGVSVSAVLAWHRDPDAWARRLHECPRCGFATIDHTPYAALLGYYLGDGHVAKAAGYYALRIACDARYPGIIDDVASCMSAMRPSGRVFFPRQSGCIHVQSNWLHWPCLLPQHGPGHKHARPIVLEGWQQAMVEEHPGAFLRGLFHSDGSRVNNWVRQSVAGQPKVYRYPRWQFCNKSQDILDLCCWALDLVNIPWRPSNRDTISVSRREAVARLDELIGLKT